MVKQIKLVIGVLTLVVTGSLYALKIGDAIEQVAIETKDTRALDAGIAKKISSLAHNDQFLKSVITLIIQHGNLTTEECLRLKEVVIMLMHTDKKIAQLVQNIISMEHDAKMREQLALYEEFMSRYPENTSPERLMQEWEAHGCQKKFAYLLEKFQERERIVEEINTINEETTLKLKNFESGLDLSSFDKKTFLSKLSSVLEMCGK